MARTQKSTALYPHPFSKAYWRDAAAELKDVKMLAVTAFMIALRVALKPLAIPLGPQMSIQTAMLATALGSMIFGPVMAIPAAMISDTIGFMIFPTGDYFLPFMLTEIASTMLYALCLYRSKVTTTRVMLSRFFICFFVNIILQQLIFAWQYTYMGNPEKAADAILGIMGIARIFKNLFFFPVETVVLTLFLKMLLPVTRRAGLTYCTNADMQFTKKVIAVMLCLVVLGGISSVSYLTYRYDYLGTSRSADYTDRQRVEANKEMAQLVLEKSDYWDEEKVFCVVDSKYQGLFEAEADYTVSIYILDGEAFAKGQADAQAKGETYNEDTLWGYSKSGPKKDIYQSLVKVGTLTMTRNERTGEILSWDIAHQTVPAN